MSRALSVVALLVICFSHAARADDAWRPLTPASIEPCNCEQTVTVRRPIVETTLREEQYTVMQPTTVWQAQQMDQGRWVTNYVQQPGSERTRLRWVRGGWATDAQTGQSFWRPGMLRPTKVQDAGPIKPVAAWQPQPVTVQMPVTSYTPTVQTRRVPVQTERWIEEQQVRRIPGCVCSHADLAIQSPAAPEAPLKPLPRPELGPTERVPEPMSPPVAPPRTQGESPSSGPPRIEWSDISRVAVLVPLAPVQRPR